MSGQRLDHLLQGIAETKAVGPIVVSGLALDSRKVQRGNAFFALRGTRGHGIEFVQAAVQRGASVVLAESPAPPELQNLDVPVLWIDGLHAFVGEIAARFFGRPSEAMRVIGVTGTNGKTSTVQLLAQALEHLGHRAATIGTLGAGLHGQLREGERTTPDAIAVQQLFAKFRRDGASHVAMEVSSHALEQGRVAATAFDVAAFTNLTRDHLDYHGSMEAYGAAKAKLFVWPGLKAAAINIDDAFGRELVRKLPPSVRAWRLSNAGDKQADIAASDIVTSAEGVAFMLRTPWGEKQIRSRLLGRFNVSNLLAVIGCLAALGESFERIVDAVEALEPVNGRMNRIGGLQGLPLVVVDYAHTPDALEQALNALRAHCQARLICVFGCGGERDAGKRPQMGEIAERLADVAIVTDDNPRGEDGDAIVAQILAGMARPQEATVLRDREAAIRAALTMARTGDVVLIAGKGHEAYQEGASGKRAFDDMAVARVALETHA
ncbi:UDP-N-acetylmuramoyl-L-alanyl-D-glutamate--2,6-diaminopimelate ligase [Dyella nitratireducens]|uniref:UDP-N-acetylmuramoyl-L-alanyl-D-glutamate--2,6-diaminopimelate ligase n=1 Tax=Dyella nitratireducens TaxID=1849580 RepID=A0ABQ1GV86_9GAMM|nr:UDP-N-acetylmuramoyl-L-alanyl-D-glutamate--2,6-diaminopimelate ligase [Dyella nitratireducens]GGA50189.1 UDP-N-acetylmuramoyl-L-alanyl-D-glutamate--2,6-diaminopimelate ligase [Dyella nitratireducens]GLQ42552.1 UDP-N-acetylmuramoyl-L-alanyl-D-glutamate--2,6-diaminopimelate ligase [Dyella nitratireducens]